MNKTIYNVVKTVVNNYEKFDTVIEIGSRLYGNQKKYDLRKIVYCGTYIGVDTLKGEGVTSVCSAVYFFENIRKPELCDLVICSSALEHDLQANKTLKYVCRAKKFIVTIPFSWPIHDYPSDYWRVTPYALEKLIRSFGIAGASVFGIGPKLEPHTVVAATGVDDDTIKKIKHIGFFEDGLIKGIVRSLMPRILWQIYKKLL